MTTDDLRFGDLRTSDDDVDSPNGSLISDAYEEAEETELPSDDGQFGASGYDKHVEDGPTKEPQAANYLTMSDKQLFAKCRIYLIEHLDPEDSTVTRLIVLLDSRIFPQAADDRSQHINRSLALTRLRQIIALEGALQELWHPPLKLVRILPSGTGGKRGNSQTMGPNHPEFIVGTKALMDLVYSTGGSVSAKVLGYPANL